MKDIKAIRGSFYIARLIAEGEHEHQDFKYAISDARKIARSVSAFANNNGGRLLIGVKDNGTVAGVRNEEDIFVIEQAAQLYCRPEVELRFTAFRVDGGLTVIRAEIDRATARPVMAQEPDGRWRAYYRVADENIVAPDLMLRAWRESDTPRLMRLTDAERKAMEILQRDGSLTVESVARAAAISHSSAADILVGLHSLGLVSFRYTHGAFILVPAD